MSAYVLTLLAASAAVCVIEMLLPKGDGGRVAAHVRLVSGLFLLVALLNPLREGLEILSSLASGELGEAVGDALAPPLPDGGYEDAFGSTLTQVGRREVEAWAVETLGTVFAVPAEGCAVEAVCETYGEGGSPTLSLCELRIGLKGKYALRDPHPMEDYFEERLGCPCYVTVLP